MRFLQKYIHVLTSSHSIGSVQSFHVVAYIIHTLVKKKLFNCIIFTLSRYKNTNNKRTYRQDPPNDSPL